MNSTITSSKHNRTLIVVGNGMVGHHCVEQLIERGALDHYQLHVFSEEPMRAYDRVHLSEYFTGRDAESLALSHASLYQTPGVTLHLGAPVLEIDRARREVITATGSVAYDKLVLATGSYPFVPPIRGWSTVPLKTSMPSVAPPRMRGVAWWSAVVCSAWKPPTP